MKRASLVVLPAIVAGLLWGCGGSPKGGSEGDAGGGGDNKSGSSGKGGKSSIGGSGGTSSGTSTSCPSSCEVLGANCGTVTDTKCGGVVECGTCADGQSCGASEPNRCGAGGGEICKPKTCADQGVECGTAGDGCGNTLNCGNSCLSPQICGGDPAKPGKCGCTGVCSQIPICTAGTTTSISGTVYDPGGRTPLYNALVYIANNPSDPGLKPFGTRSNSCDVCGATAAGDPLVSTQTGVDGKFTLKNIPTGAVTLVVQLGRWRRIFEVNIANACVANELPDSGKLTLPKNKTEGDIPRIATVTGSADGMECMLWKAGIDTAEFTNPSGSGRVHLYRGSGKVTAEAGPGTKIDSNTPTEVELYTKDSNGHMPLTDYDMLILACQGSDYGRNPTDQPALTYWRDLVDYVNSGGRAFATHWSHSYMRVGGTANPLSATATWRSPDVYPNSGTGVVVNDPAKNPRHADFTAWLKAVSALNTPVTNPATFSMFEPRFDISKVTAPGQTWVTAARPNSTAQLPLHYTFNTPVSDGTGKSCGRFVYSDFHVSKGDETKNFPLNCGSWENFTAQEKVLEFMLFDLSACVTPYVPLCTPKTCKDLGYDCGSAGDGCGAAIDCGTCETNETCGAAGPNKCGNASCTPKTCEQQGFECGAAGDGCGNAINCGNCDAGEVCGLDAPGKCGTVLQ